MPTFSLEPTLPHLHGHFSRDLPPVLTIHSGDTVRYRTLDAGWSEFEQVDPFAKPTKIPGRNRERDPGHALVGPIAIEGAAPGMTLEVHLKTIRPGAWGWSSGGGSSSEWDQRTGLSEAPEWVMRWALDAERGQGTNQLGQTVALRPFMGILGMPPAEAGAHSTIPPRFCGGNLDCRALVAGSHVFLPIAVAGGLFSLGDGHALQGDGEVSGVAVECPMETVEVEFRLHPDLQLASPRAETPAGWVTLGLHTDLDEAMWTALNGMLDWMQTLFGLERKAALAWASLIVDLRVTQVVNEVKGVHALLARESVAGLRRA